MIREEAYTRLGGLNTEAATPLGTSLANIRVNGKRGLRKFEDLPGFMEVKDWPVALAGGGPSIKRHLEELRQFQTIVSCGSAHDYLIENGITPTFAVACDPDPVTQAYFQNPTQKAIYLLSTHADPQLYEHLADYKIATWNCYTDESDAQLAWAENDGPNWHAVGGGCTVGLRALSLMMLLGFQDIHFFGFDSCIEVLENDEINHHAYQYATDKEVMQTLHKIRMGANSPGEKVYICEGYQLAQGFHFKMFVDCHGDKFRAHFHGGGMLSDWYDTWLARNVNLETETAA